MSPLQNTTYHQFVSVKLPNTCLGSAMRLSMKNNSKTKELTTLISVKKILHHL